MSDKIVQVIRHLAFEDLGSFEQVLLSRGYGVNYLEAGVDNLADKSLESCDLLIILGGPISVNDIEDYPFLGDEITLLHQRICEDRPTLGICLGAQLIAKAMGAAVYPGEQKEIGWSSLQMTEEGNQTALAMLETPVLHWHGETFDLPENATCLASTPLYPNQAFKMGKSTLGLQFHPEVTAKGLECWFIGHTGEIANTPSVSVAGLRADSAKYSDELAEKAGHFFSAWLTELGL